MKKLLITIFVLYIPFVYSGVRSFPCSQVFCELDQKKIDENIALWNLYQEQIDKIEAQRDTEVKSLKDEVRKIYDQTIEDYAKEKLASQYETNREWALVAAGPAFSRDKSANQKYKQKVGPMEERIVKIQRDSRYQISIFETQRAIEFSQDETQSNFFRLVMMQNDALYCGKKSNPSFNTKPYLYYTSENIGKTVVNMPSLFDRRSEQDRNNQQRIDEMNERRISQQFDFQINSLKMQLERMPFSSNPEVIIVNQQKREALEKELARVEAQKAKKIEGFQENMQKRDWGAISNLPDWQKVTQAEEFDCSLNSNQKPLLSQSKNDEAPLSDTVLSSDLDPLYELKAFAMSCLTEESVSEKCKLYPNLVELGVELILSNEQALATSESIVSSVQDSKDQEKLQDANIKILENLQATTEVQQAVVESALSEDKNIPEDVAQDLVEKNKELKESSEQLAEQVSSVKEQKENFYVANGSLYTARRNYVESGSVTADYKPAEVSFESESAVVAQSENVQREVKEDRSIAQVEQSQTSCSGGSSLTNIGGRKIFQYPSPEELRNKIKITSDSPAASSINCKNACGIRGANSWAWASRDNICFCGSSSSESYDYLKGMIGGNCSKQE